MKKIIAPLIWFVVAFVGMTSAAYVASAQPGSAVTQPTGSGSSVTAAPSADQLHDPLVDPVGAYDDVKAARRVGWAAALFAGLSMLVLAVGTVGRNVKALSWLGSGKAAIVVGLIGALAAAAYNAAAAGGTWLAMLFAAAMGAATWLNTRGTAK